MCLLQLVSTPPSEEGQSFERGDRRGFDPESLLQALPQPATPDEHIHHCT